jgi:5-methylthioadenosine/S-adenosylhomocysteine deaminase
MVCILKFEFVDYERCQTGIKRCMEKYDLIIENAAVLTMNADDTIIEDGIIAIKNGSISLIEKQNPKIHYQADERIDAKGMTALPGFVNTHVHCFQSLLKGLGADLSLIQWLNSSVQPFGVRVTQRQQELAALIACLEALKSGCTTLCEFFYTNQSPELADVCIETMQFTGIRSVFMRTFQDFGDEYNVPACYIESVDQAIRELERLRSTYISNDMLSI